MQGLLLLVEESGHLGLEEGWLVGAILMMVEAACRSSRQIADAAPKDLYHNDYYDDLEKVSNVVKSSCMFDLVILGESGEVSRTVSQH